MKYEGTFIIYLKPCEGVCEGTEKSRNDSLANFLLQLALKQYEAICIGLLRTDRQTDTLVRL
jgi:hypothetical protein